MLGKASKPFHRVSERGRDSQAFPVTLELGAGGMESLPFVRHRFDTYIARDIRSFKGELPVPRSGAIEFRILDASTLDLPDATVDRVLATCLIMHLYDPYTALREWQRVCKPEGVIDFLVPCDPGVATRLFRKLVSGRAARKNGVSWQEYRLVNALEHVSSFQRILDLAESALFDSRRLSVDYFPFRSSRSWNLNAYAIFRISSS